MLESLENQTVSNPRIVKTLKGPRGAAEICVAVKNGNEIILGGKNGNIYKGVNCDGIHGACAEYVAMGMAISAGERALDTVVAVHEKAKNGLLAPCGNCRQMLLEYCPEIKVILNDDEGRPIKVGIRDLLPFAWETIVC